MTFEPTLGTKSSSGSLRWAPLVHARTLKVDFRDNFIVLPADFSATDIQHFKRFVLATTVQPQDLARSARWSLVRSRNHIVVGVTCMTKAIADSCTHDEWGRPLYGFFGFVAPRSDQTQIPRRNLSGFSDLVRFVRDRWETDYSDLSRIVTSGYDLSPDCEFTQQPEHSVRLNQRHEIRSVWPADRDSDLWAMASRMKDDVSLLLGLPGADALQSAPFLNATAKRVTEFQQMQLPGFVAPGAKRTEHRTSNTRKTQPTIRVVGDNAQPKVRKRPVKRPRRNGILRWLQTLCTSLLGISRSCQADDRRSGQKENNLQKDQGAAVFLSLKQRADDGASCAVSQANSVDNVASTATPNDLDFAGFRRKSPTED